MRVWIYLWNKLLRFVLESRNQFLGVWDSQVSLIIKKVRNPDTYNDSVCFQISQLLWCCHFLPSLTTQSSIYSALFSENSVLEWARKAFSGPMDNAESEVSHITTPWTFLTLVHWHCCSPATCSHLPCLFSFCHHHEGFLTKFNRITAHKGTVPVAFSLAVAGITYMNDPWQYRI